MITVVIGVWCRINHVRIPPEIHNIIRNYCKSTKVYSTGNKPGSGHPENTNLGNKYSWNEIEFFKNCNIIKITVGKYHSVFLNDDGVVFVSGDWTEGGLGLGLEIKEDIYVPMVIKYFTDNKIKIVDIESGPNHNLALDEFGGLYSWGVNSSGQCGDGTGYYIDTPKRIEMLKEYDIKKIKCGYFHSYCKSVCGKHFLWGNNDYYYKCVLIDGDDNDDGYVDTTEPKMFDKNRLMENYGFKEIIDVFVGSNNTKIVCVV